MITVTNIALFELSKIVTYLLVETVLAERIVTIWLL
jgi:hypothetical protein